MSGSSEMLVPVYKMTWHHTLEDHDLRFQRCENLRSHMTQSMWYFTVCLN
jgi:hypothetical protein